MKYLEKPESNIRFATLSQVYNKYLKVLLYSISDTIINQVMENKYRVDAVKRLFFSYTEKREKFLELTPKFEETLIHHKTEKQIIFENKIIIQKINHFFNLKELNMKEIYRKEGPDYKIGEKLSDYLKGYFKYDKSLEEYFKNWGKRLFHENSYDYLNKILMNKF